MLHWIRTRKSRGFGKIQAKQFFSKYVGLQRYGYQRFFITLMSVMLLGLDSSWKSLMKMVLVRVVMLKIVGDKYA